MTANNSILTNPASVKPLPVSPRRRRVLNDEAKDPEFAARMELARVEAGVVEGRTITKREIARRAGEYLGLKLAIPERTVGRYFDGRVPKHPLRIIEALAKAMHVDPGWLAFGEKSKAPAPRAARLDGWNSA